jgi:Tol biopolymer transport system component
MPTQGGKALQLTHNGGFVPAESPDGRFLYYVKCPPSGCSLWRLPAENGEESQVLESLSLWNSYDVVNEGIYFVPEPKVGTATSIQFLNFATGRTKQVAAVNRMSSGLSVSLDRRWILYSQIIDHGSDLMLVENFQ